MRKVDGAMLALAAVVAALGLPAAVARADVLVLDARQVALKRGAVLKDAETLEVPSGGAATLVLPNGDTRSLKGPFKAPVKEISKGEPIDRAAWSNIEGLIKSSAPAVEPLATKGIGATRGAAGPGMAASVLGRFSWREVPTDSDGDICVERGAKLALARSKADKAATVTVVDVQGGTRAEARFASGQETTPWPTEIAVKVGAYALLADGRPRRQITLRLIGPLPEPEATLRVLTGQKCRLQAEAWLRTLLTS